MDGKHGGSHGARTLGGGKDRLWIQDSRDELTDRRRDPLQNYQAPSFWTYSVSWSLD